MTFSGEQWAVLGVIIALLPFLMIWSVVWKGWALWIAARKGSKPWFIALLIINTVGILEILYIFWFSKSKSETVKQFDAPAEPKM